MKSNTLKLKSAEAAPIRWVFGSLVLITLYFQTNTFDPFNSPKSWAALIIATWLSGYIIKYNKRIVRIKPIKTIFYLCITFIGFTLLATIFSDFHYTAIFGETQRRNGFISYLSLALIMVTAALFVRLQNIDKLFLITYFTATVTVVYALMQTSGNDFIKWNNPYNSIIGTLGNPNFAAAVMAIMGVLLFSSLFIQKFKVQYRLIALLISCLSLYAIYKSNARQGLLAYFLGIGIFLIIWLWSKNKKLGMASFAISLVVFLFSVLGMLQIGPLEKFLYKPSVTVRGYYWKAGIEMVKSNPIFGVGMDRYGAYFKEYREVNYPLSYGFEITSTNAHNTFIQLFATGGIFLGLAYLLLNGFIFKCALSAIKNTKQENRFLVSGVFSAWMAFHAQSLISIDNIGISIWGWVLGGSLVGLSVSAAGISDLIEENNRGRQNLMDITRLLISGSATLIALILVLFLYRGEANSYKTMSTYDLQNPKVREIYRDLNIRTINTPLIDPMYSLTSAMSLVRAGYIEEGLKEAERIHLSDPRNLDALSSIAFIYEQTNRIPDAINIRIKVMELDPWNATNYLELGKYYKSQGDLIKTGEMLDKILSFTSGNPIFEQAKKELSQ